MRRIAAACCALALVVAALGLALVAPAPVAAGTSFVPGEIYTGDFPDPSVLRVGNVYYAYSTNTAGVKVPVLTSTDLVNWTYAGDVLPNAASWSEPRDLWAPAVAFIGGRYVLYYSLPHQSVSRHCISAATSSSPLGPFVDRSSAPMVCMLDQGGSIDPNVYFDGAGGVYLLFKSEGIAGSDPTKLWSQPLAPDGLSVTGAPSPLLTTARDWEQPLIENPSLVSYANQLFLTYSSGDWNSPDYSIGYAVCDTPTGPCRRPVDRPLFAAFADELGPGGPSTFVDGSGRLLMAYHRWAGGIGYGQGGRRELRVRELSVQGDRLGVPGAPAWGDNLLGAQTTEMAATRTGLGYLLTSSGGAVATFGDAGYVGSTAALQLNQAVMGVAFTPMNQGYWLAALDGGIFAFGDAQFYGSLGGIALNQPVTAMASTRSGNGYWMVANDGGVFTFGDAAYYGSLGGIPLNQPIVGMAPTISGNGYWLVAADGGVFAFGDAPFYGSTGGLRLVSPITAITATASGEGYWMVASDGGVFSFGDARFFGSAVGLRRGETTGIAAAPAGRGYWISTRDGSVIAFGDIPHRGDS